VSVGGLGASKLASATKCEPGRLLVQLRQNAREPAARTHTAYAGSRIAPPSNAFCKPANRQRYGADLRLGLYARLLYGMVDLPRLQVRPHCARTLDIVRSLRG
jgi:hypothetical protein